MMRFFIFCILLFSQASANFFTHILNISEKTEETATFAGGCFWCTQKDFDEVPGVIRTEAGYTGGTKANPTYEEVTAGSTGHVEAVEVTYNPQDVSYEELLTVFFHSVDPTDDQGQFCDRGKQYRPVIFYQGRKQKKLATEYKERLISSKEVDSVTVEILPATTFYPAEEKHQKYYKKNPLRYKLYRYKCGRDKRLKQVWGSK